MLKGGGCRGLMRIKLGGIPDITGRENVCARHIEVVELSGAQRPREQAQDGQHHEHGHGHQQVEDGHSVPFFESQASRRTRSALPTTHSELVAMPRPAAHGGSIPIKASGTHTAL